MTPTLAEIIRRALASHDRDHWSAIPCKVKVYDAATRTADLIPQVSNPVGGEDDPIVHETLPILPNVPILFPGGGGFSVTWPLAPGDHCEAIVQTLAFAQWRASNDVSAPGDLRRNSLANCIAIPGSLSNKVPIAHSTDAAFVIEGTAIKLGADATQYVALANLVTANFNRIKSAIQDATPVANDGGAALQTAIMLSLGVPSGTTFPEPIAATKVKAK